MKKTIGLWTVLFSFMLVAPLAGCQKEIADDENPARKVQTELDHLIIQEIFYRGTSLVRYGYNFPYRYDQYIKIYNPTKETQYLDGLLLVNTPFGSDTNISGMEKTFDEYLMVQNAVKFPGSGKDYPIEPGKFVLVAGYALDHTKQQGDVNQCLIGNAENSFDLSGADFQWVSSDYMKRENHVDNVPKVPDMKKICEQGEYMGGNESTSPFEVNETLIALVRLEVSESELADKKYRWRYSGYNNIGHMELDGVALKLPIGWVIDAVNICPTEQFSKTWFKQLDKGYTGVRARADDENSATFGKAVMRKHDGRNYVDTDDSTVDFEVKDASMGEGKKKE